MQMEEDRLKYTINRFDHYFDSVNNKSAVYIAINTFITGGIIVLLTQTDIVCAMSQTGKFGIGLLLLLGVLSLIILSLASIPFFSKKPNSIYYFGAISQMKQTEFYEASKNYTKNDELTDLRSQTYILSRGLTRKFTRIKWAGIFLVAQFILLLIILITILINS
ncbi:MAG: hypothetical protein GW771_05040 [Flavobacteriia bacterium]|nr:hypothetical protein [Flavobacteriia bacterium]